MESGRHESGRTVQYGTWTGYVPGWAMYQQQLLLQSLHMLQLLLREQGIEMAAIDDLTATVQGITAEMATVTADLDSLAAQVASGQPASEQQLTDLNTQLQASLASLQGAVSKDVPSSSTTTTSTPPTTTTGP